MKKLYLLSAFVLTGIILSAFLYASSPVDNPARFRNPVIWENILDFLGYILVIIFKVGTGLTILFILIGAFVFVVSRGDPIRIDKGKRILFWALIGFVVMMLANGIIALIKAFLSVKES